MRVRGDIKSVNSIIDASSRTELLLGYSRLELIKVNCTKLMPQLIAKNHNQWIMEFYETMKSHVINQPFSTFIRKKNGYYDYFDLLVCPIPRLNDLAQEFVISIKQSHKMIYVPKYLLKESLKPAIILCDEYYNIVGINEICYSYFGISFEEVHNTIDSSFFKLFPMLVDIQNAAKSIYGATINTSVKEILSSDNVITIDEIRNNAIKKSNEITADYSRFWVRIIEKTYGNKPENESKLNICIFLPLIDTKIDDNFHEIVEHKKREQNIVNETVSQSHNINTCSDSASGWSSISSESRSIRKFKLSLYDKKYPKIITFLNRVILVALILLLMMDSNFIVIVVVSYILVRSQRNHLLREFNTLTYASEQYQSAIEIVLGTRTVRGVVK